MSDTSPEGRLAGPARRLTFGPLDVLEKRRAPQQARADGADPAIFQLGL
jgi:hypothetical protein